jgi:hypothetical protein
MIVITREQNNDEWTRARLGIPTASAFSQICTAVNGTYSASAAGYMLALVDAILRPEYQAGESFKGSKDTERGHEREPEARGVYAFDTGAALSQTGFVLSDDRRFGCSPDSLVRPDGLLQIKCQVGRKFLETQRTFGRAGKIPDEYRAQVHGEMIVTGRAWNDLMVYCPGYEPLIFRATPDKYTDKLRACLDQFHAEFTAMLAEYGIEHPGASLEAA